MLCKSKQLKEIKKNKRMEALNDTFLFKNNSNFQQNSKASNKYLGNNTLLVRLVVNKFIKLWTKYGLKCGYA